MSLQARHVALGLPELGGPFSTFVKRLMASIRLYLGSLHFIGDWEVLAATRSLDWTGRAKSQVLRPVLRCLLNPEKNPL